MKTIKKYYANGIEWDWDDDKKAKSLLMGTHRFKNRLSNYGMWNKSKISIYSDKIVEKFILEEFEFIVISYEPMQFSFNTMSVVQKLKCTAVFWQKINN